MKKIIRKIGMRLLALLNKRGYSIIKVNEISFKDQVDLIQKDQITIFDVGSNIGSVVQKYKSLFPKAKIYSFEPIQNLVHIQHEKFKHKHDIIIEQKVLSNTNQQIEFFINQGVDTSSLLEPDPEKMPTKYNEVFDVKERIQVESITMDQYCAENNIALIHILKIDVQGAELKVLQGAQEMLKNNQIELIYLECSFTPMYKDQCLFDDIITYLFQFGYSLFSIYNVQYNFTTGRVIQCDATFINPSVKQLNTISYIQ